MAAEWKAEDDSEIVLQENKLADVKITTLADLEALLKKYETLVIETHSWEPGVVHVHATSAEVRVDYGYPEDDRW